MQCCADIFPLEFIFCTALDGLRFKVKPQRLTLYFQRQKAERLVKLHKFSSAVYHNLSAIRIQRCYRRARAMAVAKAQMDAVLLIQVDSCCKEDFSSVLICHQSARIPYDNPRARISILVVI